MYVLLGPKAVANSPARKRHLLHEMGFPPFVCWRDFLHCKIDKFRSIKSAFHTRVVAFCCCVVQGFHLSIQIAVLACSSGKALKFASGSKPFQL